MGRTPVPLLIVVDDDWAEHPKVVELREKGHTIVRMSDFQRGDLRDAARPDMVLARIAWAWNDEVWKYLDTALKAARARKKKEKK